MTKNYQLLDKIDVLIGTLAKPLPPEEIRAGWTVEAQQAMLEFFKVLRTNVLRGKALGTLNISRGMDHWGIVGGTLLDAAAELSACLKNKK